MNTQIELTPKKKSPSQPPKPEAMKKVLIKPSLMMGLKIIWNRVVVLYQKYIYEGIIIRKAIERFYLVFGGHIFFETLTSAVKFDLFTVLDKNPGLTSSEIARTLNIKDQPARILLLGLTSVGFLKKKKDRCKNTRLSKELFTKDSPRNVIPYVLLEHHGMYKAMPHFYESLKENKNLGLAEFEGTEPTFYERLSHNPELEQIFQDAMQALSVQTNQLLAQFADLSHVTHLVDVGGGDGTNIITLAKRFPHLRATVFDLPSVCEIARKNIEQHGLSDRLSVMPGNCFKDPLPKGTDCFLFSHFFTIWSKGKDKVLLQKVYDVLPEGGQVMVFNMMQHDDGTGPLSAAVGSPYFLTLATGEGMLYTWKEYETWMKGAGFRETKRHLLPRDHGIIVGKKGARK
jgi:ubiquinone/menaquinone biosynthesis C-methylase UbiE